MLGTNLPLINTADIKQKINNVSIPASPDSDGYLSSENFKKFNSKLDPDPEKSLVLNTEIEKIHSSSLLGSKSLDETNIGDKKVLRYNAISGAIEYSDAADTDITVVDMSSEEVSTVIADITDNTNLTPINTVATRKDICNVVRENNDTLEIKAWKEIRNPLTTTDVMQEMPIGFVYDYIGGYLPPHFLYADGSIKNIADYPLLANAIGENYGAINFFGGDGITTFGLPYFKSTSFKQTPVMTSDTTPPPCVATASSTYNVSYSAWKAFNGTTIDAFDAWSATSGIPTGWVQLDFGTMFYTNRITMRPRNGASGTAYAPKDFTIQGSFDGINFTVIKAFTGITWSSVSEEKLFEIPMSHYSIYRVNVTAINGGANVMIGDIKFMLIGDVSFVNEYQIIKYEPTLTAVNQYGGFQKNTILETSVSTIGTYQMTGSISDYDFLYITISNSTSSIANFAYEDIEINTDNIDYSIANQFVYSRNTDNGILEMFFHFSDDTSLVVDSIYIENQLITSIQIVKIVGVLGSIPSLLIGGEF